MELAEKLRTFYASIKQKTAMKRKRKNKEKEQKKETIEEPINETEVVEAELTKEELLENELSEIKDKHLRLFAEFENYRGRMNRQQLETVQNCASKTVLKFLPIIDDFDRAAQLEEFSEGVTLVHQKLKGILDQLGIQQMKSTGEAFDPELHEAITEIPAPSKDLAGKVIDTVEPGYLHNEKVLRFAKVVVGKA